MEQDRRAYNRRSNDERLAVLEDRYGNLNERVMALEEILKSINGSVDRMATEVANTHQEFANLRADVKENNEKIRADLAPLVSIQDEARATFRFLRKVVFWLVLPSALLYMALSGIPAAESFLTLVVKVIIGGMGH